MGSALRVLVLSMIILTELGFAGRMWLRSVAEARREHSSCEAMRAGVGALLGNALGSGSTSLVKATDPADGASAESAVAMRVDHYLALANLSRPNPMAPDRPLARRVHGLNFVPGPRMHCTVYVLTDATPGSERVLLRQYLDGIVHEQEVAPVDPSTVKIPGLNGHAPA